MAFLETKVPTVLEEVRIALEAGDCAVIGLQSTGESAADRLDLTARDLSY